MRDATARLERLEALVGTGEPVAIAPLYDDNFAEQRAFIEDEAALVVLLCTRRSGKSFGAALRLLRAAYKCPGASVLFLALTRDSAKGILWKDVLKVINRKWKLGARFNETSLTMTLPNGSVVYLLGADANDDEKEKLLGRKYAEVCIDEAASYSVDMFHLVYGTLKPAVADYRPQAGAISLVGTPGNLKSGLYFELTNGQDPRTPGRWSVKGWSGHRWSAFQNPHIRAQWASEIAELKATNPDIEQTPAFQQNYYGVWVIDETKLVYRYLVGRNDFNGTLPGFQGGHWHFVLGIDLGFRDASSFVVDAYHDLDRTLYRIKAYKKTGLDITGVSQEAEILKRQWPVEATVIDGANKQAVEELNRRHGLGAQAADKREKAEFIDIMNAEFIQGRIRLAPDCQDLRDEYAGLIWDDRKLAIGKRVEHAACENHCADAGLYSWRHCWQYLSEAAKAPAPRVGSPEWLQVQQAAHLAQLDEAFEREAAENAQRQREEFDLMVWGAQT